MKKSLRRREQIRKRKRQNNMAIIRASEIKLLSEAELNEKLKNLRMESMKANAQRNSSQNAGKIKEMRKTIARINSLLRGKKQKQ